jgi:hypothetical protein
LVEIVNRQSYLIMKAKNVVAFEIYSRTNHPGRRPDHFGPILFTMLVAGGLLGAAGSGFSGTFPSITTDEPITNSMGVFRILVLSKFQPMMDGTAGGNLPYYGYSASTTRFTSPILVGPTSIGESAAHCLDIGASPLTAASPGVPCSVSLSAATASYSEFTGSPPGFPLTGGYDEIFTYIINLQLTAQNNCAPSSTQTPATAYNILSPMVYAGLQNYPSIHKSIGRVVSTSGGACTGITAHSGFTDYGTGTPAHSFFDIFMNAWIPDGPGTDVPVGGFYLYNDPNPDPNTLLPAQPLIVENADLESLPPGTIYQHDGALYAVPVKMLNAGQDASGTITWQAGETFGMLTLSGHELNVICGQSLTSDFIDRTLGPNGQANPEPPCLWAFADSFFPSSGVSYSSVPGTNVGGGSVNQIYFTNSAVGTVYFRSIKEGNLINPIMPPAPGILAIYSDASSSLNCEVSVNGTDFFPATGFGPLQLSITNLGNSGGATLYGTTVVGLTNLGSGPFGSFVLRQSPTKSSTGTNTLITSGQGSYVASFLDVSYELSVDAGNTWIPSSSFIRLGIAEPPCGAPGQVLNVAKNGTLLNISWSNPNYTLQGSTNLSPAFWTTIPGASPVTFDTTTNGDRFFRVVCP